VAAWEIAGPAICPAGLALLKTALDGRYDHPALFLISMPPRAFSAPQIPAVLPRLPVGHWLSRSPGIACKALLPQKYSGRRRRRKPVPVVSIS